MKPKLKDYSHFRLTLGDIIEEARKRCLKEMYARSQPAANYDDILNYYIECEKKGIQPDKIYQRHYLSNEECEYILNKYLNAYHFKEQFKDNCDIIIRDLEEGCTTDIYVPNIIDNLGNYHPGHRSYKSVPPLSKIIGGKDAKRVIKLIKDRRNFYRFDIIENEFSMAISMGDSPTSDSQSVIEYWKTQGIDLEIDPRHYSADDFWSEENDYSDCEEGES